MDDNVVRTNLIRFEPNRLSLTQDEALAVLIRARAACNKFITTLYPVGDRIAANHELRQILYDTRQELDNVIAGMRE
jgi:hypothetical protein